MATGAYHRHVETLRGVYRSKRDAMLRALEAEFADWPEVKWTKPAGGLYVWLTFPPHVDAGPSGPLVPRALDAGVLYVPGEFGHVPDEFGRGAAERGPAELRGGRRGADRRGRPPAAAGVPGAGGAGGVRAAAGAEYSVRQRTVNSWLDGRPDCALIVRLRAYMALSASS